MLNGDGTVIDFTNASLGHLAAGQTAILTFDYLGSGDAATGEIAELTCHDF